MNFPIFAIFLVLWTSTAIALPISSHVLPREYHQRQNLPEIPGYIPVYIKQEGEPLHRWKDNMDSQFLGENESRKDEQSISSAEIKSQTETSGAKPQVQPEHKSKTKKVSENFHSLKVKESKE